ncbi:MAG: hypothetical protein E7388_05095 [Ruminococcaceae bacterium]|nr:hypothetical protein [Oscillospiraceae bacterium]
MKKHILFFGIVIAVIMLGCIAASAINMDFVDGSFLWQEDSYLLGIPAKSSGVLVKSNFESTNTTIKNEIGALVSDSSYIGTGATVSSSKVLTTVVYGDVNGDGRVTTADYIMMKKTITDTVLLQGAYKKAADVNKDGQIAAADYMMVKSSMGGTVDLYENMSATPYQSQFEKKDYSERKADYRMDRNKINIGLYGYEKGTDSALMKESYFEEIKNDFGATFIAGGRNSTKIYNWCNEYQLGVIPKAINFTKYTITSEAKPTLGDYSEFDCLKDGTYKDYDCFWGDEVFDEPEAQYYPWLAGAQQLYDGHFDDKFIFFNLNPCVEPYNESRPTACFGATDYQTYVNEYVKQVDTDYVCFDVYPFDNGTKGFRRSYLYSMDIVSTAARESGRDFWIIIQSGSTAPEYKMTPTQLQWQVYTSLAYGANTIMYASYMPWWFVDGTCMINNDGSKNDLWYGGQEVNKLVNALSSTYMEYEHLGVTSIVGDTFMTKPQLRRQSTRNATRGYDGTRGFKDIQCETGLIVGSFEKKDSKGYAMMLVESCDPYDMTVSSVVTFKVADSSCSKVTAYPDGKPQVLTAVDGVYTLELASGQGLFVTVE